MKPWVRRYSCEILLLVISIGVGVLVLILGLHFQDRYAAPTPSLYPLEERD